MYYDHHILNRLAKVSKYELNTGILGPRMQSAVINGLENGGLIFAGSGLATTVMNMVCDAYEIPIISMAARSKYYKHLSIKRLPVEAISKLREWKEVDMVTFRMTNPEQWEKMPTYNKTQPDWDSMTHKDRMYGASVFTSDLKLHKQLLTAATAVYANTEEYKQKIAPIVEVIKQKKSFVFTYRNNQIVGGE